MGMVNLTLSRADAQRLHTLLLLYESPFTTTDEESTRADDVRAHERLRRRIALALK